MNFFFLASLLFFTFSNSTIAIPPHKEIEIDLSFIETLQSHVNPLYAPKTCVGKRVRAKDLLNQTLKQVSQQQGLTYQAFSGGWINKIQHPTSLKTLWIYGHQLGANSSVAARVCADKNAASTILTEAQIPCVEHFHLSSVKHESLQDQDPWKKAHELAQPYAFEVVLKPKEGGGSRDVYKTKNWLEIQSALSKIFAKSSEAVLSPFYTFNAEYRTVLYKNTPLICFEKQRPILTGDGQKNIKELLIDFIQSAPLEKLSHMKKLLGDEDVALNRIMMPGEEFKLEWKHAMGLGAHARLLSVDEAKKIIPIALKAAKALDISFCAVDIFCDAKGTLRVLEINSAPTLDHIVEEYGAVGHELILSIYAKTLLNYFSD